MTDEELIANLRDSKGWPNLGNAAAKRIEQLVKDHRFILDERDRTFVLMLTRAETAEAKLAKAVEALRETDQTIMFHTDDTSFRVWGEDAVSDIRKVLDELEKTE